MIDEHEFIFESIFSIKSIFLIFFVFFVVASLFQKIFHQRSCPDFNFLKKERIIKYCIHIFIIYSIFELCFWFDEYYSIVKGMLCNSIIPQELPSISSILYEILLGKCHNKSYLQIIHRFHIHLSCWNFIKILPALLHHQNPILKKYYNG